MIVLKEKRKRPITEYQSSLRGINFADVDDEDGTTDEVFETYTVNSH